MPRDEMKQVFRHGEGDSWKVVMLSSVIRRKREYVADDLSDSKGPVEKPQTRVNRGQPDSIYVVQV